MEADVVFIFGMSSNGVDRSDGIATYTYFTIAREMAREMKGVILQHIKAKRLKPEVFIAPIGTYHTLAILEKSQLPTRSATPTIALLRPTTQPSREKSVG